LLLANFGKEGTPQPIAANVSQETLAEMIGTTAPVSFRKLGFITSNCKIEVHGSLLNSYSQPPKKGCRYSPAFDSSCPNLPFVNFSESGLY
jgi:CRP/FNR family transcriptional regulator, cyclic AMP receptor protein